MGQRHANGHDREPGRQEPIWIDQSEQSIERPRAVTGETDRECPGCDRNRELPPDLAASGPKALRPVSDDRDNNEIAGDDSGADRPAQSEHREQPAAGLGKHSDVRPEKTRPETNRLEPPGDTGDRAALAD